VPAAGAADAISEAIEAEIALIVCIHRRHPGRGHGPRVKRLAGRLESRLIGPNCPA